MRVSREQAEAVASSRALGTMFDGCGCGRDRPVARVEFRSFGDSWMMAGGQLRTVWIAEADEDGECRQFMAFGVNAADLRRWCAEDYSVPVETVELWFDSFSGSDLDPRLSLPGVHA